MFIFVCTPVPHKSVARHINVKTQIPLELQCASASGCGCDTDSS